MKTADDQASEDLAKSRNADFIVWDRSFLDLIGPHGKVEEIQSFPEEEHRVHEAPVFLEETNELLYSDTDIIGWLWAVNIDTHETRKLYTDPPLNNVNGATYHDGLVYLTTNGGKVRGLYSLNVTTGKAETILNNYRGRRFNSPNDLVFDSKGNILFTDPTYGWYKWPGVQPPELPKAVYSFNPSTGTVTTLSNNVVFMPNGLALARDEKTLYIADSASTPTSGGNLSDIRNVWAFDYEAGTVLRNPRVIYQADSGWPDGIRVTAGGYLMIAVAGGIDVVDPESGLYLGKINTPNDIIFNVQAACGKGRGVWLLTGLKHIYKVTMDEGGVRTSGPEKAQTGAGFVQAVKSFVAGSKEEL